MLDYTALAIRDPQKAADMFTQDGAFEMPYLATFGYATKYKGREAIAGFFRFVRDLYPDFEFENVQVLIDTPEQVFAEYEFTAVSSKTGREIHQHFFGRLVAENGKIKLLREALNSFEVARTTVQDSADLF
jgi:ketosteroid isomerase-like protein